MASSPRCGSSWIRRFLLEHLVRERNLARNTQYSYRDTLALLMPFVGQVHKPIDQLDVVDVSAENVRSPFSTWSRRAIAACPRAISVSP